jgi:serine/threonine protein kinase
MARRGCRIPTWSTSTRAGTHEGSVFLAMEHVDGEPLNVWLRSRRRGQKEILAVFLEAGRGLAAAHDAGLVHRDFKPHNVIIGHDGRIRVLDFGLARGGGGTEPAGPPPNEIAPAPTAQGEALTSVTRDGVV